MNPTYDALLLVSFGGPEQRDDVLPFLENVLRGRRVPRERMLAVAEHYYHFGGRSPINDQNRALIAALQTELAAHQIELPIYWGNRNWHPLLSDTLQQMAADGVRRSLAFFTSAFSSYSGCRQYRENIAEAQAAVGPTAPEVHKLRAYFNHPGFLGPVTEHAERCLATLSPERRQAAHLVFTAHSIPQSMADGCRYATQLRDASAQVAHELGISEDRWQLVYQSRSGPPTQPWLEPDVCDHLPTLSAAGVNDVVVVPIGFVSDHLEVLYDLDTEARGVAESLGIHFQRAATVGTHPRFVSMIRELILERLDPRRERPALGNCPPLPDECPANCCLLGATGRPA